MALREYSAFNKSAGASILAYGCNLTNMDGTLLTGTAPLYFQIHDKATAPVLNDVPIKSYEITSSGPFPLASVFQTMGTIPLANGLAVGISSTANTYTAATATYSVFGEVEEGTQDIDSITGLSIVGDTITHVDNLLILNTADAGRLFKVTAEATTASARWLQLHQSNNPQNGDVPLITVPLSNTAFVTRYFGKSGFRQPSGSNRAIYFQCSSTAATLTQTVGSDMVCKVWASATENY